MAARKHIVLFGTATNASGETIAENTTNSAGNGPSWSTDKSDYSSMNVVIDVKTITGTSITFSIQEKISGVFVETAASTAITATGRYVLNFRTVPAAAASKNQGAFPALGMGTDKQVVTTASSLSAIAADVYFVFLHS